MPETPGVPLEARNFKIPKWADSDPKVAAVRKYRSDEAQRLREVAGLSRSELGNYDPSQHPDLVNAELTAEGEARGEKLRAARIKEQKERLFERPPSPGSNLRELEQKLELGNRVNRLTDFPDLEV